jgi:hypothetical protein
MYKSLIRDLVVERASHGKVDLFASLMFSIAATFLPDH